MNDRLQEVFRDQLNADLSFVRACLTEYVERAVAGCKSPIEQIFACALSAMEVENFHDINMHFWNRPVFRAGVYTEEAAARFDEAICFVFTQAPVMEYVADFLIAFRTYQGTPLHKIVIECDGHDFHERTKEQARHDRSRDRKMTAAGFKVFRFTGSEIYGDPKKCVAEIKSYLDAIYMGEYPHAP